MTQNAVRSGSSVVECAFMFDYELAWGKWYRSKGRKGGESPFASYMLNKKWTLQEELNNHMMQFQQVRVSANYIIKDHFDIPGWPDSR